MTDQFILDTNIILDFLLVRQIANPFYREVPQLMLFHGNKFLVAEHQLEEIESVFRHEVKRLGYDERKETRELWSLFKANVVLIETPDWVDREHPLVQHDFGNYRIHQVAELMDARIITRNADFIKLSPYCITPAEFLQAAGAPPYTSIFP